MLLIKIFVELRVVAGRSRTRAGSPQAVSQRPCCAVALRITARSEHGMGTAWAWHDKCESDTAALCKSNGKKTHSKYLAARPGKCESDTAALCKSNGKDTFLILRGTAWRRNGMGTACCV